MFNHTVLYSTSNNANALHSAICKVNGMPGLYCAVALVFSAALCHAEFCRMPLRRQKQGKNKAKDKERSPEGGSPSDLHGHLPKLCEDVDFLA